MTPQEVASALREIAQLLTLKGENTFKVRAYEAGAEAFEALPPDPSAAGGLLQRVRDGTLAELSGVGKAIDEKVTELVRTGQLRYLDGLRKEFPHGALDLVRVPGVGPKKALRLIRELDVASLADLQAACKAGRLRELKGFGEKSEAQILEGLRRLQERTARRPLCQTRPAAEALLELVRRAPGVAEAAIAGSVRRFADTSGDVDLVAALQPDASVGPVMDAFCGAPLVSEVIGRGETKSSVRLREPQGLQADLRVVGAGRFATALHHFTGSKAHHLRLRGLARQKGLTISEYALAHVDPAQGGPLQVPDEAALYRHLGLHYVPPELREDDGELEAGAAACIANLVAEADVQGLLHCHTTWSDGQSSVEEMARVALGAGRRWLAITDHTWGMDRASGLDAARLEKQAGEVARVQALLPGLRLLRGAEVEILEDGSLDLPDAVLERLEVPICSLHHRHGLSREAQTARLERALSHPRCRIWGHPTGRLAGQRSPIEADWDRLFALCAARGVAVECNGKPDRLDLPADLLRRAVRAGCTVGLGVDAHRPEELVKHLPWALGTARRAGVERAQTLNALSADALLARLRTR